MVGNNLGNCESGVPATIKEPSNLVGHPAPLANLRQMDESGNSLIDLQRTAEVLSRLDEMNEGVVKLVFKYSMLTPFLIIASVLIQSELWNPLVDHLPVAGDSYLKSILFGVTLVAIILAAFAFDQKGKSRVRKEASELPPELVREVQGYKAIAANKHSPNPRVTIGDGRSRARYTLFDSFALCRGLIVDRSAFELNPATKKVTVWGFNSDDRASANDLRCLEDWLKAEPANQAVR